jgi:hypothetical protein
MESTLVHPTRLIEYPNDLSRCDSLEIGQKKLLYLCSRSEGGMPFVVVLGFYAGQREDYVNKDLIEPVGQSDHHAVTVVLARSLAPPVRGSAYPFPLTFVYLPTVKAIVYPLQLK